MTEGRTKRNLWIALVALLLLAALIGAGWWVRPIYRHHKELRSLRQAQTFFAAGDFRSGLLSLRQTLLLNPDNLDAVRLMADFATQTQSPAALTWWRRSVELAPTTENKSLLAAAALRLESPPFPLAAQTIDQLAAAGVTNVSFHLLAAQLALKLNRGADAELHLTAASSLEPTNQMHQVNLATLHIQSRHPATAEAARQKLMGLMDDAAWSATVLRALLNDALARTNASAAQRFSQLLLATPQANFSDRLLSLNAAALARDPNLMAQLQRIQTASATNALETTQIVLWMQQHQTTAAALIWLETLDPSLQNVPPVALVAADCFLLARDWAGLEQRLSRQKWAEQDFFRFAYLARALREQGLGTTATANWERAVGAALPHPERAGALAQLTFNWGWQEEGVALLWQIAKRAGGPEWPLQNLLRIYAAAQDTAGMQRVHEQLILRHPESLPIKNNLAMLSLLLQRERPRATQLAQEVFAANRTNGIFASTYAFALHLEGQSAAGLKILQSLSEPERLRPEVVPYYALLLAACGETENARQLLRHTTNSALLPEEKMLLAPLTN